MSGEVAKTITPIDKAIVLQTDPVCGMTVDPRASRFRSGWNGRTYHFCSDRCRSKFIADKVAVPSDLVQAMFGQRFKVEDGKIVGYDAAGNKLFSRSKPGEIADFDESLEMLVDSYANRDAILKGTGNSGSGTRESNGTGGGKSMSRTAFEALDPGGKAKAMADKVALVD